MIERLTIQAPSAQHVEAAGEIVGFRFTVPAPAVTEARSKEAGEMRGVGATWLAETG